MRTVFFLSLLVGLGRLLVPGHEVSWAGAYEAFAHIWVGVLFCLWLEPPYGWGGVRAGSWRRCRLAPWALLSITVLEVVKFALLKIGY